MPKYQNPGGLTCSFCHKSQREVEKIIAGPNVYICSECIRLCLDIIREKAPQRSMAWGKGTVPSPSDIKAHLDNYVIGQETAKRRLSVAVYNHYKRLEANTNTEDSGVEVQKSNVLLIGPTGTGKTLMASTLASFLDVPFVIADATSLTEAGYVGEDVENIVANLYQASGQSVERTIRGIIYVDEVDKLARKNFSSSVSRDVSGEGVQQALLKILEGTVANIQPKGKTKGPNNDAIQIDTTNILFICGGSFEGLASIIEQRMGRRSVGFLREDPLAAAEARGTEGSVEDTRLLKSTTAEDLTKFGLIPEFIGRLPVQAIMSPLAVGDLVHVMTEPRNALVKQYQKLFRFEKVKLTFSEDALIAIAEKALTRKSGARGLRAVTEAVMLDIMFEVPSIEGLEEVIITADTVRNGAHPELRMRPEAGIPS